jgi:hypothetical protein
VRLLVEHDGRRFFVQDDAGTVGAQPFDGAAFPLLVWDHVGTTTGPERCDLARALIRGGCRYAVCGGLDCSEWEEAFDESSVMENVDAPDHGLPDSLVTTTSHAGEDPDDVAFFFVRSTDFDRRFESYLVLHVGGGPLAPVLEDEVTRYALDPEEDSEG